MALPSAHIAIPLMRLEQMAELADCGFADCSPIWGGEDALTDDDGGDCEPISMCRDTGDIDTSLSSEWSEPDTVCISLLVHELHHSKCRGRHLSDYEPPLGETTVKGGSAESRR